MSKQDTQMDENNAVKAQASQAPDSAQSSSWSGARLQFWLFCLLLALALGGMGLTQASETGGAFYWLIVLWIYALLGLIYAWLQARRRHEPIWSRIHLHVFHWLGALVTLHIVFWLERNEILSREAASDVSMLVLALSSYLAGLHLARMFVLIGIILAAMAIVGAVVEQYMLWLILVPTSVIVAWLFLKSGSSKKHT